MCEKKESINWCAVSRKMQCRKKLLWQNWFLFPYIFEKSHRLRVYVCVCEYKHSFLAFPAHFSRHKLMDHHSLLFSLNTFLSFFSSSFSLFNWLLLKYVYIISFSLKIMYVCVFFFQQGNSFHFPFIFIFFCFQFEKRFHVP